MPIVEQINLVLFEGKSAKTAVSDLLLRDKTQESAIPRVINAAFVLSPKPKPSATPAARAITFFKEPPN